MTASHETSTPNPSLLGLPHRPPFVFVRELLETEPGRRARCAMSFDAGDAMFAGHFPGNPLVPGVILTEALAQTAGIAAASGFSHEPPPLFLLSAIRSMKFLRAVRPGEQIVLEAEKLAEVGELMQFQVSARVGEIAVAEGQLVLNRASPEAFAT